MNNPVRWKQRFQNFEKALTVFKARCCDVTENPQGTRYYETCQMALILAFEIVIELSWKTLKDYLEAQGYADIYNGKKAIRQAFQDELIEDGEVWLKALDLRNITSHTYDISILKNLNVFIVDIFLPEILKLDEKLKSESKNE